MDANFIFGLIFMTGTGGSIYGIELYLSFCRVIMGDFLKIMGLLSFR